MSDWYVDHPGIKPYDLQSEFVAMQKLFQGPWIPNPWKNPTFGPLALLPLAVLPISMVSLLRRRVWAVALASIVVGGVVWFYCSPNFTVVRQLFALSNPRFLYGAFFPLVMLSLAAFRERLEELYLDVLLLSACLHLVIGMCMHWHLYELQYIAILTVFIALTVGSVHYLIRKAQKVACVVTIAAVLVVGLSGLQLSRDRLRWEAAEQSFFFHDCPRYWVDAAQKVDEPPIVHRIAVTSGAWKIADNWFMYMFMGTFLQNSLQYVPITESGKILHFGPGADNMAPTSFEALLGRINSQGITDVMSFWPSSVESRWMQGHPEVFERITGDASYGLYRVHRTQGPASHSSN